MSRPSWGRRQKTEDEEAISSCGWDLQSQSALGTFCSKASEANESAEPLPRTAGILPARAPAAISRRCRAASPYILEEAASSSFQMVADH